MTDLQTVAYFDGHNDALCRLWQSVGADVVEGFLNGGEPGHLDLPKARQGNFVGGLFAIYVPAREGVPSESEVPPAVAQPAVFRMFRILTEIERRAAGAARICRSAADVEAAIAAGALAMVPHIEGAEAIDDDLDMLYLLHAAGLRSIGPVWSRPNRFAYGVPFRFPSSPDIGPGLTERGKEMVRACNRLGILVDLSHMNEKGFWDIAALSDAPLVATHSNVHAITAQSRNLTDRQLDAIRASGGLVGLNFATRFLRSDGRDDADTGFDVLLQHLDYLIERLGEGHVGFGSDFDGATMPTPLSDAGRIPDLVSAMRGHGYGETLIEKLCHGNWLAMLRRTLGS